MIMLAIEQSINQSIKNLKHAICRYSPIRRHSWSLGGDKSNFKQMSLKMFS